MDGGARRFSLSLITRHCGPAFQVREIVVPPGAERTYKNDEWTDAMVIVESGTIELDSLSGQCTRFTTGDVLFLAGLRLRLLRNPGPHLAVLSATSRRI